MEISAFQEYCEKIAIMGDRAPEWYKQPHSIIADYLRGGTAYGFGQVLVRLLAPAYETVKKEFERNKRNVEAIDLNDVASLLFLTDKVEDYRFSAYYFAVCVAAVGFFGAAVESVDCESFDENELIKFDSTVPVQEEADPYRKQLKRFGIRLLDFSRTNQLVHFRPIKSATMSLLCPDVSAALHHVIKKGGKVYLAGWKKLGLQMLYKCKICGRIEFGSYSFGAKKQQPSIECPICDEGNTHNRKSMAPFKESLVCLPDGGYQCSCGNKVGLRELEQTKLVCPKCGKPAQIDSAPVISESDLKNYGVSEMVCGVGDSVAGDVAKTLLNKAKNMERNFGLHVLYLACGFLKWKDTNGTEYNSPILLCPINMGIDKTKGQYYFEVDQSANSAFEVNKTLIQMLSSYSKTCSITLPQLDETNVGIYFSMMRQSFQSGSGEIFEITKDWKIEAGFGIGLFHYQKLQLHHDIETNADKYLQHPIIRRLCGDTAAEIDPPTLQQRHSLKYMMLDADSSQEEVIKASQEGRSFILQGPPGSGKSQTITNIISSALGDGKTVLFVTEKFSARSVILDNLSRCSSGSDGKLNDFVLDFEGFKKRSGAVSRNPFVAELNRCLKAYTPAGGYDDQLLADEELGYAKLKKFMSQMRDEYDGRNYLRLLQDMAQYSTYKELDEMRSIPTDRVEFTELCDLFGKYYSALKNCGCGLDYKKHPLYGCKGDLGNDLYRTAAAYGDACKTVESVMSQLKDYGWAVGEEKETLKTCGEQLRLWSGMPKLTAEILEGLSDKKILTLLNRAKERRETVTRLSRHEGVSYEPKIDTERLKNFDLKHATVLSKTYASFFKRLGKNYRGWLNGIFECLKNIPAKFNYKTAIDALNGLRLYSDYSELKAFNAAQAAEDVTLFGYEPDGQTEWDELINKLSLALTVCTKNDRGLLDLQTVTDWSRRFDGSGYQSTVSQLRRQSDELIKAMTDEETLGRTLAGYLEDTDLSAEKYPVYRDMAERIVVNRAVLADWHRLHVVVNGVKNKGWLTLLEELIAKDEKSYDEAKARLFRSYYQKIICGFISDNGLDYIRDFTRIDHERLIANYAQADRRVLSSGARRLYEMLKSYLKSAAAAKSGGRQSDDYPKIQSKTNYSIKRTIAENWEYVKRIKPCFMMSPLNVSQYVDVNISFDLVIFDEASQIFTEDALATILRGRQVIIAGDSKQLPPCDFFRAGESIQDEDEQYLEEEENTENSLLVAADKALSDASIALTWHYRSCDEALIAFANKEMEYNLISFPSATRNANDGIRYVHVPYTEKTCYVAGKGGSHINPGEADRIVELIYSEMTNPERENFSIGVVAFSNAQAFEIETRWEAFKQKPDKKAKIERWEKMHEDEPLIFCNLDTVQGDERDTTIISICYSPDSNGKFILPYLGRIRLLSGMKRINVAVTRARHQMIVVSTLQSYELKAAIQNSSAPDDNKAGAQMLYNFLEYAQSFEGEREIVCRQSYNPFVASVCKVLDENKIRYDTEIGRSECKISIGIRNQDTEDSFVLGIIVDDPVRADFDSVREYARLTEQVLTGKYGWKIYRIYPTAWVNDYAREKQALLEVIRQAIAV